MKEITVPAKIQSIPLVTEFVEEQLSDAGCPIKIQTQIAIAIDEIFSNIAQYAYAPGSGSATLQLEIDDSVTLTFMDNGAPYDPLSREDPDVTLSAEQRNMGGLGIYMVKKSMDSVSYQYRDNTNILTISKRLR